MYIQIVSSSFFYPVNDLIVIQRAYCTRATLRIEKKCIDFIVTSKEFEKPVVTAHDLIVPPTTEAELRQAATPRGEVRPDAAATAAQDVTDEQRSAEQLRLHRTITNHSPLSTTLHFAK